MAYKNRQPHVYTKAFTITPNDSTVIAFSAIYVGTAGTVTILSNNQENEGAASAVGFSAVAAGTIIPVAGTKIMATGTNLSMVVGLL